MIEARSAPVSTGSRDRCCRFLLPEDQKGRFPDGESAFDLREVFTFSPELGICLLAEELSTG
jgi:hypothetical protein